MKSIAEHTFWCFVSLVMVWWKPNLLFTQIIATLFILTTALYFGAGKNGWFEK